MIPYTIRLDEVLHRKLKVIAALHGDSLNKYLLKVFADKIEEWERTHGVIEIPQA